MALVLLFLALVALGGCVAIARHEKALAWRRDVAIAIEIAHSYRKARR